MRLPAEIVAVVAPELQVVAALVTVQLRMTVLAPPGPTKSSNNLVFVPPGAAVMRTDRFCAVQAVLEDRESMLVPVVLAVAIPLTGPKSMPAFAVVRVFILLEKMLDGPFGPVAPVAPVAPAAPLDPAAPVTPIRPPALTVFPLAIDVPEEAFPV